MITVFTYLCAFIWGRAEDNFQSRLSPSAMCVPGLELSLSANPIVQSHLTNPTTVLKGLLALFGLSLSIGREITHLKLTALATLCRSLALKCAKHDLKVSQLRKCCSIVVSFLLDIIQALYTSRNVQILKYI